MTADPTQTTARAELTPAYVRNVTFPTTRSRGLGLDESKVAAFKERVADTIDVLTARIDERDREIERLRRKVVDPQNKANVDQAVSILAKAQQTAEAVMAEADAYSRQVAQEARSTFDAGPPAGPGGPFARRGLTKPFFPKPAGRSGRTGARLCAPTRTTVQTPSSVVKRNLLVRSVGEDQQHLGEHGRLPEVAECVELVGRIAHWRWWLRRTQRTRPLGPIPGREVCTVQGPAAATRAGVPEPISGW